MPTSSPCFPWQQGQCWRCQVLCWSSRLSISRTSSGFRWAHRDHDGCRRDPASFVSAVKCYLWRYLCCFYPFQQQDSLALENLLLEMPHRGEVFPAPLRKEPSRATGRVRAPWVDGSSPHCQHGQSPGRLWVGGMSLGLTAWTLLHLCEGVSVVPGEQNVGSKQTLHGRCHKGNPSSTEKAERGADHLNRAEWTTKADWLEGASAGRYAYSPRNR